MIKLATWYHSKMKALAKTLSDATCKAMDQQPQGPDDTN